MLKEIMLDENIEWYSEYYHKASHKTIYHHPQFLLAEQKAEKYKIYLYVYEEEGRFAILPSVKRKINDIDVFLDLTEEFYDLITPHEYSGMLADRYDINIFRKLYTELRKYCVEHNIIFQFIRFNPYSEEYKAADGVQVVYSDAQDWVACTEDVLQHFQKRKAAYVRSAVKNGMCLVDTPKHKSDIECFFAYYTKAMDRLKARRFLYFNNTYFTELCKEDFVKLFLVKSKDGLEVYSGAVILCDKQNRRIYYHLVFKNYEKEKIHSMEYMIFSLAEWAREHGYVSLHLGGGGEQLHRFKDGCTDKRVDYYIGSVIYNEEVYQALTDLFCKKYPEASDSRYLPVYRFNE